VVARAQHGRDLPAPVLGGPRVLRLLEQAAGEGLVLGGRLVAEHAGDEPGDGFDDDERRGLPSGEDVVADGELVVAEVLGDALVDALVAAAQQ